MKAYFIFAITLTVAYVIYFAVMIARDLYGNGGKKKSGEEEFDVSGFDEEESVSVVENDKGSTSVTTSTRRTTSMRHKTWRKRPVRTAKSPSRISSKR